MNSNEMTPGKNVTMNELEINQYFKEFLLALDRKVQKISGFRLAEADDFKQYCACWLLDRPSLMSKYKPHVLASVCAGQRAVDFYKKMNSQLPQGKWVKDSEAIERKTIQYLDSVLNSKDGNATHEKFLAAPGDLEEGVVNNLMLSSLLTAMTPRQQQVFLLVEVEGHQVVEAAIELGLKREMAQRELGKARKVVAELREEFGN
jgi:DNA-directed RNA polymerase specialized sigma24 family protein